MPKVQGKCLQCAKPFLYYPSAQSGTTCSRSCSLRYLPRKPIRGEERACEVCGKSFYRNQSELAKSPRFCSVACHNVGQSKASIVKLCAHCGTEMRHKPSQARVQFCSRQCMGAAKSVRLLDRNHNGRPARVDRHGYVWLWEPEHPGAPRYKGWIQEHRLVAEGLIGRHLVPGEEVDHINGIRDDNRPENLQILSPGDHARKTSAEGLVKRKSAKAELAEYRRRFGPLKEE